MPSIPQIKIGSTIYDIKDVTAREHLVEVSDTQPVSEDNKLWIKEQEEEYIVPTMEDFEMVTGNEPIPFVAGKYINLTGEAISIVNGTPAYSGNATSGFGCGFCSCSPGEVFTVNGQGGSSVRLYGFAKANGDIIEAAPASIQRFNHVVTAPKNAAWFVYHNNSGTPAYRGRHIKYAANETYLSNAVRISDNFVKIDKSASGISFTWTGNVCRVNGTATATVNNFFILSTEPQLYDGISSGKLLYLKFLKGADSGVAVGFTFRAPDDSLEYAYCYNDEYITVPNNVKGVSIYLYVGKGKTISNVDIQFELYTLPSFFADDHAKIEEIVDALPGYLPHNVLPEFGTFNNATSHGVTYSWSADKSTCVVNGVCDSTWSFNYIWEYGKGKPPQIESGETYDLTFESTGSGNEVAFRIFYYYSDGTSSNVRYTSSTTFTVPTNCNEITIRLDVAEGVACNNISLKVKLFNRTGNSSSSGSTNTISKMFSVGSSFMTGWIYVNGVKHHECTYDNTPYGNVAIGLGIEQKNVLHILMPSTGLLYVDNESIGNILTKIKSTDLSQYDYVLTQINRTDLGISRNLFAFGDLNSTAGDGTVMGAVLDLLDYVRNSSPNATLIMVGPPPSDQRDSHSGQNVFTASYMNGLSIHEVDILMHRLAVREHFIFIDWEDLDLSYRYKTLCDNNNVHPRDDQTCRAMGLYLARQCNYATSIAKVLRADMQN